MTGGEQLLQYCLSGLTVGSSYAVVAIGFNIIYLLDVLTNLTCETVQCSFGDASSSALITVPGNDNFKYVVMPMRI